MQCVNCNTRLQQKTQVCWNCGQVPNEKVQPPEEHGLTPSEVVLLNGLSFVAPARQGYAPRPGFEAPVSTRELVIVMLRAALLGCKGEGMVDLDLLLSEKRPGTWGVGVKPIKDGHRWNHFGSLEARILYEVCRNGGRIGFEDILFKIHRNARYVWSPAETLLESAIGVLKRRGLVDTGRTAGRLFGRDMPWKVPFNKLTESGKALSAKHPPGKVLEMLADFREAEPVKWDLLRTDIEAVWSELEAPGD